MIEQPMPKTQLDDIAWVTQQSPLPIFADESLQRLSDVAGLKGAFHGINIKLMKCTGMREGWKMVTLARALGMKVMVGCMTKHPVLALLLPSFLLRLTLLTWMAICLSPTTVSREWRS